MAIAISSWEGFGSSLAHEAVNFGFETLKGWVNKELGIVPNIPEAVATPPIVDASQGAPQHPVTTGGPLVVKQEQIRNNPGAVGATQGDATRQAAFGGMNMLVVVGIGLVALVVLTRK